MCVFLHVFVREVQALEGKGWPTDATWNPLEHPDQEAASWQTGGITGRGYLTDAPVETALCGSTNIAGGSKT